MYNSKFIITYKSLNNNEKRHFRKYIESNYVIKYKEVLNIFKYIDSRKHITPLSVDKRRVFDYIFPNKGYDDVYMRQLIFQANKVIESFIVLKQIDKSEVERCILLSEFYKSKELYHEAMAVLSDEVKNIESLEKRNSDFHFSMFRLNKSIFHIQSLDNRSGEFNMKEVVNNFNIFVILEVFKQSIRIFSIKKVSTASTEDILFSYILNMLEENKFYLDIHQIRIYYLAYKLNLEDSEILFNKYIKDLNKHENLFVADDLNELFRIAINFCIKMVNKGIVEYNKKLLQIYLYVINKKILLENNELSRFTFTNIVTIYIKLKLLDDCILFIEKYKNLLNNEYRQNTIDFNYSKVYYEQKKYSETLLILNTCVFKDVLWNLNAKNLVLKILFETEEYTIYESSLYAFISFVNRQKNIGYHKEYFINLYKAHRALLNYINNGKVSFFNENIPQYEWFVSELNKKNNA